MKTPLEYGDNFPVPAGAWDPSEPWRFPNHGSIRRKPGLFKVILPWLTLGLGLSVGFFLSHWTMTSVPATSRSVVQALEVPTVRMPAPVFREGQRLSPDAVARLKSSLV